MILSDVNKDVYVPRGPKRVGRGFFRLLHGVRSPVCGGARYGAQACGVIDLNQCTVTQGVRLTQHKTLCPSCA